METPKKILVYENEEEIKNTRFKVKSAARHYDLFYKEYLALNIPKKIGTVAELYEMANDPEGFVRQVFLDKIPNTFEVAGVSIKRSAIDSHIDMPDLTGLKDSSLAVRRAAHVAEEKVTEFGLYKLSDTGVEIDEEELSQELERWRRYATTEEDLSRYRMLQELCDRLNEVKEYFGKNFTYHDKLEDELRPVLKKGNKYIPNHQFVKPYTK